MAICPSPKTPVLNVLAVEDDPSVAQAVAIVLGSASCNVVTAASADEALAKINRESASFDVLITDNRMPAVSGGELVQKLREQKFNGRIVVLSAYVSPEEDAQYRALGVQEIVAKPFAASDLRRAVGLRRADDPIA